jgi:conjugative transfer signal peptidase TraF
MRCEPALPNDSAVASKTPIWIVLSALVLVALGSLVRHGAPLRLNLSSSIPAGWYVARDVRTGSPLQRGTLVAACLPSSVAAWGRSRGYLHRGSCPGGTAPVGKPIFAIGGDTVVVRSNGLELDGTPMPRTGALPRDSDGRPLMRVPDGRYVIPPGEVWLVSTFSPRSWDSRYFGSVPASAIVSALTPLWVFTDYR